MDFTQIKINEWQQFSNIDITFHEKLTILTGSNGSGKTTILNILARHKGWGHISLAIPKLEKNGAIRYALRAYNGEDRSGDINIGEIKYSNNTIATLQIPNSDAAQYQIHINAQPVRCFFIPSHRPVFRYHAINNIQTSKKNKATAFQEVWDSNQQRYFGGGVQPSSFFMKNTLIGWAIQGYGVRTDSKSIMPPDQELINNFEGFQNILKKILPTSIGFKEFEIRNMEIVFICNEGKDEFILETSSGGISALIDIAWLIYMYSTEENSNFTVIIDEIENHLHPTMQRRILQDLVTAFPHVKFIVSTHSPLIVSSVRDSYVYALRYDNAGKVNSCKLDFLYEAKNAIEILDDVLGVSFTMPIWVEEELDRIVKKYSKNISDTSINEMRNELKLIGLEKLMPSAIYKIVELSDD